MRCIIVPYGLGTLPSSLSLEDPRLPSVHLTLTPLRLNTHPLPATAMQGDTSTHAARVSLLRAWLNAGNGPYAPGGTAFIDAYLAFLANCLDNDLTALQTGLARYHDLYSAKDLLWSALRPLPRAWVPTPTGRDRADFAFWNGTKLICFALTPASAGISVSEVDLQTPEAIFARHLGTPDWTTENLPSSPFRQSPVLSTVKPPSTGPA